MDLVMLSRIQFAVTIFLHFIFVPLTIGLGLFVAIIETLYVRTGDSAYKTLARFWGKLFAINFLLGVVTGLTMEFQFGTNWSRYSEFMGDIFGSPLAFEALMAFFLESTFVSVWIFGWNKFSPKFHAFSAWMIALGTHLSAVWIIVANGFMQHPVGYVVEGGRARLVNFWAVFTNGYAWHTYIHMVLAAYSVAGFFVLGVAAWHLLRRQHVSLMRRSARAALIFALVGVVGTAVTGDQNARNVARVQPAKFAAMESVWQSEQNAPFYLFAIPDAQGERNMIQALPVPNALSFLVGHTGEITGLKEFPPANRPPVGLTFWSFRLMVGLGVAMLALAGWGLWLDLKGRLESNRPYLKLLPWMIPVPYLAIDLGWMVAEVGRQPWTVYGLMKTADSVSPVPASSVLVSFVAITVMYLVLVGLDIYFLAKAAKMGPQAETPARAVALAPSPTN